MEDIIIGGGVTIGGGLSQLDVSMLIHIQGNVDFLQVV